MRYKNIILKESADGKEELLCALEYKNGYGGNDAAELTVLFSNCIRLSQKREYKWSSQPTGVATGLNLFSGGKQCPGVVHEKNIKNRRASAVASAGALLVQRRMMYYEPKQSIQIPQSTHRKQGQPPVQYHQRGHADLRQYE